MSSDRKPSDYSKPPSLNEVERKRNVDALNFENKLMLHRLKTVPPVLSNKEIKHDFEKHLAASSNLRRKQMKPMSVPKDLHTGSSLRKSTFDSSTYSALLGAGSKSPGFGGSAGFDMDIDMSSPITTMQDFRRQVISSKKSSHHKVQSPPKREAEPVERNETLYELSHG